MKVSIILKIITILLSVFTIHISEGLADTQHTSWIDNDGYYCFKNGLQTFGFNFSAVKEDTDAAGNKVKLIWAKYINDKNTSLTEFAINCSIKKIAPLNYLHNVDNQLQADSWFKESKKYSWEFITPPPNSILDTTIILSCNDIFLKQAQKLSLQRNT